MIRPIRPPSTIEPPEPPEISPLRLRAARSGRVRFIIQFREGVPLPEEPEIPCTAEGLRDILPDAVIRRLCLTEATAYLSRLFPGTLGAKLDQDSARLPPPPEDWMTQASFQRYYRLCLTDTTSEEAANQVLASCATVFFAYPEPAFALDQPRYHPPPIARNQQTYLGPDPLGINAEAAWKEGVTGSDVGVGFAEDGPVQHPDLRVRTVFDTLEHPHPPTVGPKIPVGRSIWIKDHAVSVAGLLAAQPGSYGVKGICGGAELLFSDTDPVVDTRTNETAAQSALAIAMLFANLPAGSVTTFSFYWVAPDGVAGVSDPSLVKKLPDPYTDPDNLEPRFPASTHPDKEKRKISHVGWRLVRGSQRFPLRLECDPVLRTLFFNATAKGVTVCCSAGNGLLAEYADPGDPSVTAVKQTPVGSNIASIGILVPGGRQGGSLTEVPGSFDRSQPGRFRDSGVIIVGAAEIVTSSVPPPNPPRCDFSVFGNRIDCYAQGRHVVTLGPEDEDFKGQNLEFRGTSAASPIVAGSAVLVQSYLKRQYDRTFKPAFLRALLSDPGLGTPCKPGDQIGSMPDLGKIIALLKAREYRVPDLLAALRARANQAHQEIAATRKAASPNYVHDPYTVLSSGQWQPMKVDAGVFN